MVIAMRARFIERPAPIDASLALVLLLVGMVSVHRVDGNGSTGPIVVRDLLVVALFLPLAWRRRAPRTVLTLVSVAAAATWVGNFTDGTTAVAGGIAFYGLGRHVERPTSWRAFGVSATLLALVAATVSLVGDDGWYAFLARCGLIGACFAFGDSQRSRVALVASLRAQAERAESLRVVEAQRAVSEERSRIAREMHDVVAHSLSVMVVQSVAAERLAGTHPQEAVASISNVAEIGRRALGEMRRIFDIFDTGPGPADFTPQPTLADLDSIVGTYRSAGMRVSVECIGGAMPVDAGIELAIVRIVQEALTNVLKHSNGADAVVRLCVADVVTVEVSDTGSPQEQSGPGSGSGRGLIGMRERVDAMGGTLTAQRVAGRGFEVRAVLPLDRTQLCESNPCNGDSR
jgi:signal transduction histidine kinase